ncbi:ABC transporter permease [Azospirillum canadense]|uniref:ABC transporter permease n=1 Tax=Azospirillum canadense TaxID=403962 RepID=UPI002227F682|nr:ABC transporter permease [Azospirillum canadense]MCW2240521.1 ABC-type dipeptide/oligopeptide/nickel transport system permease subunit [Azospirillum canadense]
MNDIPSFTAAAHVVAGANAAEGTARRNGLAIFWRQFRRSQLALPGGLLVLAFVLVACFAPLIATHDPLKNDLARTLMPPGAENWFGTDELGRDVLSRVVYGARLSLSEGLVAVLLALAAGVPIGVVAGYVGGRTDMIIMRLIDVLMAFPGVLLAIAIISVLGPSLFNVILAVALYTIPIFARLARGATLSVKEEPYIEACRALGVPHLRTLWRHVLPNIAAPILVIAALRVAISILTASSLSFLGLGAQPPSPEWGAMLASGRNYILIAPHLVIFPGLAIVLLVFGLNLFQDGLRIALDPKTTDLR